MIEDFKIDVTKTFGTLAKAPIVEAALGFQARVEAPWELTAVQKRLSDALPAYPKFSPINQIVHEINFTANPPAATTKDLGQDGLRFFSERFPHVALFARNGFAFSRLQPYETWEKFTTEAMRLWDYFVEIGQPSQIQRADLRYINRIELPPGENRYEDYIRPAPEPPQNMSLPFYGFFHNDVLAVPGHDYSINIVRTIQSTELEGVLRIAVILDITVMTTKPFPMDSREIAKRLPEMRSLKNQVFYGSITEKALNLFQ